MVYIIDAGTKLKIGFDSDDIDNFVLSAKFTSGDKFIIVDNRGKTRWINMDYVVMIEYSEETTKSELPEGYKPLPGVHQKSDSMGGF